MKCTDAFSNRVTIRSKLDGGKFRRVVGIRASNTVADIDSRSSFRSIL